jgi:iron(II)-dependent oxidoreductase
MREHRELAARLEAVRRRTLSLVEPIADEDLRRQVAPIVSPVIWDLAHMANFEEIWCLRRLGARPSFSDEARDRMLDAIETPRPVRGKLDLPSRAACLDHMALVRAAVLESLERTDLASEDPLVAGGTAWELACQHEEQHQETILQTLALFERGRCPLPGRPARATAPRRVSLFVPEGPFLLGTDGPSFSYDNERPARAVSLPAFEIDAAPVTQGEFLEFVRDGGYTRRELWSDEGWALVKRAELEAPLGWEVAPRGVVLATWFDRREPLDLEAPVCRVSFHEALAYARFRGKRLPTEAEWEKAARGPLETGQVWEWTSSDFEPYPGFVAFPYEEYSAVHFGRGMKVLRGGSWATQPAVARATFRNWDLPERRHIFAGIRLARDA